MKEFLAYYQASTFLTNTHELHKKFGNRYLLQLIVPMFLSSFLLITFDPSAAVINLPHIIFLMIALVYGLSFQIKPTAKSIMPLPYRRRGVYSLLSVLLSTVLAIVMIIIGFFLLMLFIFLIYCVYGMSSFTEVVELFYMYIFIGEFVGAALTAPEILFALFFTLYVDFSIACIVRQKSKKAYWISLIAFFFINYVVLLVIKGMMLPTLLVNYPHMTLGEVCLIMHYDYLPKGTLWVIGTAILAAISFGLMIWTYIHAEKPNKY